MESKRRRPRKTTNDVWYGPHTGRLHDRKLSLIGRNKHKLAAILLSVNRPMTWSQAVATIFQIQHSYPHLSRLFDIKGVPWRPGWHRIELRKDVRWFQ
jgi:hypothetical protein